MSEQTLTAAQILALEQAETKAAISRTLAALKSDASKAADIGVWTKRHPWAAVGVAVAGGFVVAKAVMPGRDETIDEKYSALKDRFREELADIRVEQGLPPAGGSKKSKLLGTLLGPALEMGRVALTNIIVSAFREPPAAEPTYEGPEQPQEAATGPYGV